MPVAVALAPKLLSKQDACAYLGGISVDTLDALVKRGRIKPVLKTRFIVAELDALVDLLARERDTVITLEIHEGGTESGREMDGRRENSAGTEGESCEVRADGGGSGRRRRGSGAGDEGASASVRQSSGRSPHVKPSDFLSAG